MGGVAAAVDPVPELERLDRAIAWPSPAAPTVRRRAHLDTVPEMLERVGARR